MSNENESMERTDAAKTYLLLEAGPIVLVTTAYGDQSNIMTMGFHMMVQHDPPLIGCAIGSWDHSYRALTQSGECVIAVLTVDLARKAVDIGNCSGGAVDKFVQFRLTAMPAAEAAAPLVAECIANIECSIADCSMVEKYNLFILEAVALWVDRTRKERLTLHHNGDGNFTVDGRVLDLRERMVQWKSFQVALQGGFDH